jgi:hypothetical protein
MPLSPARLIRALCGYRYRKLEINMGRDIHSVIQCRQDGNYWDFAVVYIGRDYKLFSAIAFGDGGVADDLPYPPRGLPFDYGVSVTDLVFVQADEVRKQIRYSEEGEVFNPIQIAEAWGDWAVQEFWLADFCLTLTCTLQVG